MASVNQYPTRTLIQQYSHQQPLKAIPSLKQLPLPSFQYGSLQPSANRNYASHKNLHESTSIDIQDISSISKVTQQQDKYLRDLNMNRRKQIEYQEKQQKEILKVLTLKQSQSTSKLFKKVPSIYDREVLPGLNKHLSDKKRSVNQGPYEQSSLHNSISKKRQSKPEVQVDDEWQLRLKLIDRLSCIQQRNKNFFRKEEDHYETEETLKAKKYFSNAIRDKIESQYNDLPASLVALNQNRQFILEHLLNRKNIVLKSVNTSANNQSSNHIQNKSKHSIPEYTESFVSSTDSDQRKSMFLHDLRQQSMKKFKDRFLKDQYVATKVQQQKKYQSRSQFDNAGSQFRFLPQGRQKKIEGNIKIIIDQKQRQKEMEKCLDICIQGSEEGEDEGVIGMRQEAAVDKRKIANIEVDYDME